MSPHDQLRRIAARPEEELTVIGPVIERLLRSYRERLLSESAEPGERRGLEATAAPAGAESSCLSQAGG